MNSYAEYFYKKQKYAHLKSRLSFDIVPFYLCHTLMKVRTEQAQAMNLVPYLEYFLSLDSKAYFMENQEARAPRTERAAIKLGNQAARAAIAMFI